MSTICLLESIPSSSSQSDSSHASLVHTLHNKNIKHAFTVHGEDNNVSLLLLTNTLRRSWWVRWVIVDWLRFGIVVQLRAQVNSKRRISKNDRRKSTNQSPQLFQETSCVYLHPKVISSKIEKKNTKKMKEERSRSRPNAQWAAAAAATFPSCPPRTHNRAQLQERVPYAKKGGTRYRRTRHMCVVWTYGCAPASLEGCARAKKKQ